MIEQWCGDCKGKGYITWTLYTIFPLNKVCPVCRGQGIVKGEKDMSEENTTETTTNPLDVVQEQIKKLNEQIEYYKGLFNSKQDQLLTIRNQVWEFFDNNFDSDDDSATIDKDDVNELLETIGAQQLEKEFVGTVTVEFSFTVRATDENDAENIINDAVSCLDQHIDAGSHDEYSIGDISVTID